jgi:hypothetical protein
MTANPLMVRQSPGRDTYTPEAHVEKLNNYQWVVASGKLYFVNERTLADGKIERFVDRHI